MLRTCAAGSAPSLRSSRCQLPFASPSPAPPARSATACCSASPAARMLGPDQPVILQLLEITPALTALDGVAMELDDCAFPLLAGIVRTDDADVAFGDVDYALLVGAMPRKQGMERSDLLVGQRRASSRAQGKALSRSAKPRRASARRRQPGQHERAHRHEQRAGPRPAPLHGHDPPRPQPRRGPAGGQGGAPVSEHHAR